MSGNDWNRSELLVMKTLERIEGDLKTNSKDIIALKVEVAKIAVKVGIMAALGTTLILNGLEFLWHTLR